MNSVTSALNMVQIVYLVNYGLRVLMMNHLFPIKNEYQVESKWICYLILRMKEKEGDVIEIYTRLLEFLLIFTKEIKSSMLWFNQKLCRLEFADHLRLPFLDQPQYDILVFAMITFQIYHILVSKWKHGIFHIDIITFNEWLEFIST